MCTFEETVQEDGASVRLNSNCTVKVLAKMEQELNKERKPANRLTSERFRIFVYFVVIACVLTCFVVLFVSLASIEKRFASFESKLGEISKKLETLRSKINAEKLLSSERHRRNVNPTTSLADLTKRLIALEGR